MNTRNIKSKFVVFFAFCFLCIGYSTPAQSQTPLVTVRFANPDYNFTTHQYCVDVEFLSDTPDIQVFGMNVRFFYDDSVLDLIGFSDFQGGYDVVAPSPPEIITSPAGPMIFNFAGSADFVNGAIQLVNPDTTPIVLNAVSWTKIFQVCFDVVDPDPDVQNFCPSLIWDIEQNPENGGYLVGDDGVVITCVDPDPIFESQYSIANVIQFNWVYIGSGTYPFGEPVSNSCIPLGSPLVINTPQNITIEFGESTDPDDTGLATASDLCEGDPMITFNDAIIAGQCSGSYVIIRTWTATNECNSTEIGYQSINIFDTTAPLLTGVPDDTKVICEQLPLAPTIDSYDLSQPITTAYSEYITEGNGSGEFNVLREWICTDACGNSSFADQNIYWMPNAVLSSEIVLPRSIECNSDKVIISSAVTGELEGVVYTWEVSGGKSFIQAGEGTPQIYIHVGESETLVTLTLTDPHGCVTITSVRFDCTYSKNNGNRNYAGASEINDVHTNPDHGITGAITSPDIATVPDLANLNLWPNPANENLNLSFESKGNQKIQINLVNFLGQTMWNDIINAYQGFNSQQVDVSQMAEGSYLIRVKSDEMTYSRVIVILHQE